MQVIVKGHHIHVNGHLKQTVTHKLEKLSRFFDRIVKLEVEFSHAPGKRAAHVKHEVEILVSTSLGTMKAHAKAADPESALDAVLDKIERQVVKQKAKVAEHPKGGIRAKASPRLASLRAVSPEPVKLNGSSPDGSDEESPAHLGSSSAS